MEGQLRKSSCEEDSLSEVEIATVNNSKKRFKIICEHCCVLYLSDMCSQLTDLFLEADMMQREGYSQKGVALK